MILSVYDFKEYSPYLLKVFGDKSQRKGLKSQAAKYIGCHSTFISQVLHGKVVLNLEQAEKLNHFLGHNDEESHYFLLLVQKARAGTKPLETYFQNQLTQILKNRQVLKKRVGKTEAIAGEDELRYYCSWQFAAIHVALSIPELASPEAISKRLGISMSQVRAILEFLVNTGLAKAKDLRSFEIGPKHIHLSSESPQVRNHHINWRNRAIQSIDNDVKNNMHYSSAVTLSREDVSKIKELLIENLSSMNKVIQQSKEEEIYGLNFDFFNLGKV
ncbi:TIGR02147 family protein [Bdellovibrio sp. HCB337]|uniref:TIGR02147 family protein n=1 Tax=Bdellovibrio sp. HCB337 TaxID=3394358 RepID=UPI0039A41350